MKRSRPRLRYLCHYWPSCCNPGSFGAMAMYISSISIVVVDIPSRHHIGGQIGVVAVYSGIEYSDGDSICVGNIPSSGSANFWQRPTAAECRICYGLIGCNQHIQFNILKSPILLEFVKDFDFVNTIWQIIYENVQSF